MSQIGVEEYARRHKRIRPDVGVLLMKVGISKRTIEQARVRIWSTWFHRHSGSGHPVGAFVISKTIIFNQDVLNYSGQFDLTKPAGFSLLAHEFYHVQQTVERGRLWLIGHAIKYSAVSLWKTKKLWSHHDIPMEREAIAFEAKVRTSGLHL